MKKIIISVLTLLLLTGCSGSDNNQTLFVADKKDHYGLVNIDGDKKTEFIYNNYETLGTSGYIVIKNKKYGYLSNEGEEIIKLGKYTKLESISNMLVGYDKDGKISILNSDGELLFKADKKTEITLSGLPIIHKNKEYIVLYDTGKVLFSGKEKVLSANSIEGYSAVCLEKTIKVYNHENIVGATDIKSGGASQLMSYRKDTGYLFYNRETHLALACNEKGKINFETEIDLDDLYYDNSGNITGVRNQTTYLFNKKGENVAINSYYRDLNNYVIKNKESIYGPHKFVGKGKIVEVSNIQLDPLASFSRRKIFPVYVRNKGYMYYGFDGKAAFDIVFTSAEVFDKNGLAVVSAKEDKYYLISQTGKKSSDQYNRIEAIGEKYYAGYVTGSKFEVINTNGKKVIDDQFMDIGTVFKFDGVEYGIFNKNGSSYVYDMKEVEVIFSIEDSLEFNDKGYFVSGEGNGYYSLTGEEIYKR